MSHRLLAGGRRRTPTYRNAPGTLLPCERCQSDVPAARKAIAMTQPETVSTGVAQADVLNTLLGIAPGSALAQVRAQRPEATTHTQGSYDALFSGISTTPVSSA